MIRATFNCCHKENRDCDGIDERWLQRGGSIDDREEKY
jgi:hypothetical protein